MAYVIIGIDVGLSGGITILDGDQVPIIYKMPLEKIVVNKKKKNTYDMLSIVDICKKYKNRKVLFCIEKQGVRPGEGAVSAMTIGKGFGQLLGVGYAFGFKVVIITPVKWKKIFPFLDENGVIDLRGQIKDKRIYGKTLKDIEAKKENKKCIEKLQRDVKSQAKTNARELATDLFPELSDRFVKKNSDGLAESLLIALYGRDKQNELVQNG